MAGNQSQWTQEMRENWKKKSAKWLTETSSYFPSITNPNALSSKSFTNRREFTRETLAERLCSALQIINFQSEYVAHLENGTQQLKSDMIKKQERVIELQEELLAAKEGQLQEIQETITSSVGDTVKTELKSYSEAVQRSGNGTCTGTTDSDISSALDKNVIKSVMRDVVAEEDRSKNLVIFGLAEETGEEITEKVSQVLQELGEKPKLEANRIGLKSKKNPRPVKVSVSDSIIVLQILRKARNLHDCDQFKLVFISPDRTPEQRTEHRELVEQLKLKRDVEKDKRHYIKGGQIYSVDKR